MRVVEKLETVEKIGLDELDDSYTLLLTVDGQVRISIKDYRNDTFGLIQINSQILDEGRVNFTGKKSIKELAEVIFSYRNDDYELHAFPSLKEALNYAVVEI